MSGIAWLQAVLSVASSRFENLVTVLDRVVEDQGRVTK